MNLSEVNFSLGKALNELRLDVDENDPDEYGLDVRSRKRLKMKKKGKLEKKKVQRPLRTRMPFGLRRDYSGAED